MLCANHVGFYENRDFETKHDRQLDHQFVPAIRIMRYKSEKDKNSSARGRERDFTKDRVHRRNDRIVDFQIVGKHLFLLTLNRLIKIEIDLHSKNKQKTDFSAENYQLNLEYNPCIIGSIETVKEFMPYEHPMYLKVVNGHLYTIENDRFTEIIRFDVTDEK